MGRLVSKKGMVHSAAMVCLGIAIGATTGVSLGDPSPSLPESLDARFLRPPVGPTSYGCTTEQTAYASAVANYQTAAAAVQETYNNWYECEMGGGMTPNVSPDPGTESVLIRD